MCVFPKYDLKLINILDKFYIPRGQQLHTQPGCNNCPEIVQYSTVQYTIPGNRLVTTVLKQFSTEYSTRL